MNNTIHYKGYTAVIQYSADDHEFFGKVIDIQPHGMIFGGKSIVELEKHMKETVDGYLEFCDEQAVLPKEPYSGRITIRTTPQHHAELAKAAMLAGKKSMNEFIMEAAQAQAAKVLENRQ